MTSVITLTTDFGLSGPYVGAMKGVILSINLAARLVDITHSISAQNVRQAAIVLASATPWFPDGTIHLVVVDPGVGTERSIIYAEIGAQRYVCPDNGLLSRMAMNDSPQRILRVTNAELWLKDVSATFHGRDILAPVAARLSLGLDAEQLGPPQAELTPLDWPQPKAENRQITGSIIWIDDFGNLITDIPADMLASLGPPESLVVEFIRQRIPKVSRTYGEHPAGALIALIGSTGQLEIAAVAASAASQFQARVGTRVTVTCSP